MTIIINEVPIMKSLLNIFLVLSIFFLPGDSVAQETSVQSGVSVEQASLTRPEASSRSASVKVLTDRGYGSGIFVQIGRQKVVFTAHHVVRGTQRITIISGDRISIAEVIYADEENDFAVIRAPGFEDNPSVKLRQRRESREELLGVDVHYSGYPAGHSLLTIRGTIAGIDRGCYILQSYGWMGASGSGVFDRSGRLIGILTAIDFSTSGPVPQLIESIVWVVPMSNIDISSVERSIIESL